MKQAAKDEVYKLVLTLFLIYSMIFCLKFLKEARLIWTLFLIPFFMLVGLSRNFLRIKTQSLERFFSISVYVFLAAITSSLMVALVSMKNLDNYLPLFFIWLLSGLITLLLSISLIFPVQKWKIKEIIVIMHKNRWELLGVILIIAFAFCIRVWNLAELPSPFMGDEAAMAIQAIKFNEGTLRNMFSSGLQGHPNMYFFILSWFHRFFGAEFAQRFPSVLVGTLTIPVFYLLIRRLFGKLLASCATIYLLAYHVHHHYSRVGMNNIGETFIVVLILLLVSYAYDRKTTPYFVLLGLSAGVALYFYAGARLIYVLIPCLLVFFAFRDKLFLKATLKNLFVLFLSFCIIALPLCLFWINNPSEFFSRINSVGLFQTHWIEHELSKGRSLPEITFQKLKESFGVFGFYQETGIAFYKPPIPLVDFLSLVPFLIGAAYSVFRIGQPRYFIFVILFFLSILIGGVLTVDVHSGRLMSTIPVVSFWTVLGVFVIISYFFSQKKLLNIFVVLVTLILVIYNVWFYYSSYSHGKYYADWNTRVAQDIGKYVTVLPNNTILFMYGGPHLFTDHPSLLIHIRNQFQYYDVPEGEVKLNLAPLVASPRAFVFIYDPVYRLEELHKLQKNCPGGTLHGLSNKYNELLFTVYGFVGNSSCVPA